MFEQVNLITIHGKRVIRILLQILTKFTTTESIGNWELFKIKMSCYKKIHESFHWKTHEKIHENNDFYPKIFNFDQFCKKNSPSGGPPTGGHLRRWAASGGPLRGGLNGQIFEKLKKLTVIFPKMKSPTPLSRISAIPPPAIPFAILLLPLKYQYRQQGDRSGHTALVHVIT